MQCFEGGKLEEKIRANIVKILELIGRYCPYSIIGPLIEPILKQEFKEGKNVLKDGLIAFEGLSRGFLEAVVPGEGLQEKVVILENTFEILGHEDWISAVDSDSVYSLRSYIISICK